MLLNRQTAADAKSYPTRILQFGEGNFLRAFTDWIVNVMNKEIDFNSGIDVVQPLSFGMVDALKAQDNLYHVLLKGIKDGQPVQEYVLVDAINKAINPYSEYAEYEKTILNPDLRFVISNTTEAGISWDGSDKLDMQPQNSFPGKVASLLYKRYKNFNGDSSKGLIFFTCELIDRNGDMLKQFVIEHAKNWELEAEFITWINEACYFANTLVDRIVPGFPKEDIKEIQAELGFEDNLVVVGEYFHFWVIEAPEWVKNEFPAEKAGLQVKFVDDMTAYREQKVQVLNGCHTGSFAVAHLSGIETVKEAYDHETVGSFMRNLVYEEVVPALNGDPEELKLFSDKILERFANPYIRHLWQSIALNANSKWETRNLPTLLSYHSKFNKYPQKTLFSLAALIAYFRGEVDGKAYSIQDDQWLLDFYKEAWGKYDGTKDSLKNLVESFLKLEKLWKKDMSQMPNLVDEVTERLSEILEKGMLNALKSVL